MSIKTLISLSASKIPKKIRLFKPGKNNTSKGEFIYNTDLITEIMANYILRDGRDQLPIDLNHNSLNPYSVNPDSGISVGWWTLMCDDLGIWATDINWTQKGLDYLSNREYRFISPAFTINDSNEIVAITNFALTNEPATYDALPLVANKNNNQGNKMASKDKKLNEVELQDPMKEEEEVQEEDMIKKLEARIAELEGQLSEALIKITDMKSENNKLSKKTSKSVKLTDLSNDDELDKKEQLILKLNESLEEQNNKIAELEAQVLTFQQAIEQKEKEQIISQLTDISEEKVTFLLSNLSKDKLEEFVKMELTSKPAAKPPESDSKVLKSTSAGTMLSKEDILKMVENGYKKQGLTFNHPSKTQS